MATPQKTFENDLAALALLKAGRLRVDALAGLVYATESKTPTKPIGSPNHRGYLRTCITTRGKAICLLVHRLVWIAANGVPEQGQQINHKDGCKTNNSLANLELATAAENNLHARQTGLWKPVKGAANGFAKLTDEQVLAARSMKKSGASAAKIASIFGISAGYARRVVKGAARACCPG